MGKATLLRFTIWLGGTVSSGLAAVASGAGTGTMVFVVIAASVVSGILAERTFRSSSSPEEIRRDLEERLRKSD